jgi:hypothetical protein
MDPFAGLDPGGPVPCRIVLRGHLDGHWAEWFDGCLLRHEADRTILLGPGQDQAALLGLLLKVRDLGLTLLAVEWRARHAGIDRHSPSPIDTTRRDSDPRADPSR